MSSGGEPDIRFALMAVVPDKKIFLIEKLKLLNENRSTAISALHNVISQHSGKTVNPPHGNATSKSVIQLMYYFKTHFIQYSE